ncbi:type II toxin-antitoxin system HicA family toxin [Ammoniphilus sp. CFH 90114]|uniref:type II toxin-antitoxin system HicA family toxin n=1 Tax=Ammoniphilus sp. CFH 90114 TaxID=2493665 RepID=UPI00100E79ED|nr:type II toxin-antitoxin system HicA family toxin [Ammoniphilus sp. CFH 90114]RXT00966.1 type II toxin-antitoxin system HicA family toxin [Ammoniphilus sp. CFH 90114]
MKAYSSRELMKLVEANGWELVRVKGEHYQFKHPTKPGLLTIPHPKKDFPLRTQRSILKQAGIEE